MGIFDKLFGKASARPPLDLSPTSELMGEDQFWQFVADSLTNSHDQDSQEAYIVKSLEQLAPAEIVSFRLRTDKLLYDTYTSEMWCAAYIMNGGCSDDGFEYFRLWVISRGREVYEKVKNDPDSLISEVDENAEFYDFESFWYVALTSFKNKTGKNLYDYIDYNNFKFGEGNYPQFDFTWSEDDLESMKEVCPVLFERLSDI